MRTRVIAFVIFLLYCSFCYPERPLNTYSIVARDPVTGELGVAVQTHYFAVGRRVPWAEAGVGAVATQSFTEVSYGPLGLELMRAGKSASETLQSLVASDEGRDVRQVAMIDSRGEVAAYTGKKCIEAAGHQTGKNFSVQANLMENPGVWPAMARTFESTTGTLAERMLAALESAQAEGGDIRGQQSAAILVVSGRPSGVWWKDRVVDLRVDDHPQPLQELRRLLNLLQAYSHEDRGDDLIAQKKIPEALAEYQKAVELAPENEELIFWAAVSLYTAGEESKALDMFRKVFSRESGNRWVELVGRLPAADLLPAEAVEKIRSVSKPEP